ncbi:MAG: NADH:ubiquinone reductase (Na(+)-transporting) subunit E [Candidatus Marinimicrobia bacterium]|jgi:Na+-transporting NADH:ubiquinone oxidoreductase subunit E|nr:NADH:ubiquinone reductase (Na(+)-transporting) subunit E [Gammaproteobacteria bacterium]MBL6911606.1 NADH:ubiquinone reductase (Na(+)-transporting) subunit E [Candidatus Neomarinimicrobiota bacterium]MBT3727656.1 NADH:ubiquinone reductase (Na(+)-transporting) subunit E [Candidatus Neomarinimicrobiota bacterium]MBT3944719.1 NADH:ubiquinone reductase (Na(+)-transporting) subunit E [Candidatus Neomarinimicrobiota bacterium]MBT4317134.1 NADH:ubiquinone reductase (Na(+)-transporting) subunit E [C
MGGFEHYLSIFTKAVFIENIVLAYFLGLCSFLAISKKIDASVGIGMAVVVVLTITAPINWFIYEFLLSKGALVWLNTLFSVQYDFSNTDLSFLKLIVFISVIAAMVQLVEMFMERFSQSLYNSLGIFLPLIAVNCSILGGSLFMVEREYNVTETMVYGFGSGVGFFLAIVALASVRYRLRYSNIPPRLRGVGMAMLLTGLLSMAFMAFSGIDL